MEIDKQHSNSELYKKKGTMSNLLNELNIAVEESDHKRTKQTLEILLKKPADIELENYHVIDKVLCNDDTEILKLVTKLLAELAKTELNRNILTQPDTIKKLTECFKYNNLQLSINAVRCLGNICFENEEGCKIIEQLGMIDVISLLKDANDQNELMANILGLLMNLFNSYDGIIRSALKQGIAPIIEKILIKYTALYKGNPKENQILITFLVSVLNNLLDYADEYNIPFSEENCKYVIEIFKTSDAPGISVSCLEIFHGQIERDDIKCLLAKEGVCELLFDLIQEHRHEVNDEDRRSILKMACDVIVIILTEDECMYLLYNNGEGKLYNSLISWLDIEDPDLLSTAVLAIGNFARKDIHCHQMVNAGISKKLLTILSKYNNSENIDNMKIQHALLSTLKNLAIPAQNKTKILQEGIIDVIYPMITNEQSLVVFKLVGTFRMVIDGQEETALDLLSREDFIKRLVHWFNNSDHLGVRGEVPRLISWLIKNCNSYKPFIHLLEIEESLKCLVEMISSSHAMMQNEALSSLDLVCTGSSELSVEEFNKFVKAVIDSDIGKHLQFVVNRYGEKMNDQTITNLLSLIEHLLKSEEALTHLNKNKVKSALLKINITSESDLLSDRLNVVLSQLSE